MPSITPEEIDAAMPPVPTVGTPPAGVPRRDLINEVLKALRTDVAELETGKIGISDASPVTVLPSALGAADRILVFRGDPPVAHVETLANLQAFLGAAPAATAPAALTVGQWSAEPTLVAGQIGINITALPSNGGSAITGLEYRVGTGAAIALSGTGTGLRTVTAGFSAGVAAAIQVRAVNAVGAGAWSDTKTRTPLASAGGAAYIGETLTNGSFTITGTLPAGTTGAHYLTAIVIGAFGGSAGIATMPAPAGWTANLGAAAPVEGRGCRIFSAPASVGTLTFAIDGISSLLIIATTAPLRTSALSAVDYSTASGNEPSPSVSALAGELIVGVYVQPGSASPPMVIPGTPQAGYTREFFQPDSLPVLSVLSRAGVAAGATGTINHDAAGGNFNTRYLATMAY